MTQIEKTSPSIYRISKETFLETVRENTDKYHYLNMFWLPIIEKRTECLLDSAEDCLLNPIFRWCYLDIREKLKAFDKELEDLNNVIGHDDFVDYHKIIMGDIIDHPTENQAHDRMLDARAEIRGILHYAKLSCSIDLESRQQGKKTHDFNANSGNSNIAVEAKFIRHPDKLLMYLMRWWQAQSEISGIRPLGSVSYIKFKRKYLDRDELSLEEIGEVKQFFKSIFEEPHSDKKLSFGRVNIMYSHANRLEPATAPLEQKEQDTEHSVDSLISKIRSIIEKALNEQLDTPRKMGRRISCYLLLNLTCGIECLHKDVFEKNLTDLKNEYSGCGLEILTDEVGYL